MDWIDEGIVLSCRAHGETAAIAHLLTRAHGRHAGLVHGGMGRRQRPLLQAGNLLRVEWQARLAEQLGTWRPELMAANAGRVLDDAVSLAGLSAACAVLDAALPEREPHPAMFDGCIAFLSALGHEGWPMLYVHLELGLLQELGFGLDLASCALTGVVEDLAYVSPRTGRAVAREAAAPWIDKLLPLPGFLARPGNGVRASGAEILSGLALTGHFLERHVFWPHDKALPAARGRLMELLQRQAADQSGA